MVVVFKVGIVLFVKLMLVDDSLPIVEGRSEVDGVCELTTGRYIRTPEREAIIVIVLITVIK
jgi:hypothetical protein